MTVQLSKLSAVVGDSPTLKINAKTAALKKEGFDVLHLGGGEPEYPAPPAAIQAIIEKAKSGKIKYSPTTGTPEMKKAVIKYTQENYDKTVEPGNIIVSTGAKQAIYNFLLAAVNPGDEVIFPVPYWVSYPEMVSMIGAVPVEVMPDKNFQVTIEAVKAKVTPKTKAILLNSPNNPSGTVFSEEFIKEIVEFCEAKGIYLAMDDIYHKLTFDGKKCPSAFKFAKEGKNLVIINGVSKLYGLTGLRIGWAVSENKELIAAMGRMQAQTTSCNSVVSEVGAAGALMGDQGVIEDLRSQLETRRNAAIEELKQIKDIGIVVPQGTFYTLVDFSKYGKDSIKLAEFLLEKALVSVVPGVAFGLEGFLRVSYCSGEDTIRKGIRRIRWALDKTSPDTTEIGGKEVKRTW